MPTYEYVCEKCGHEFEKFQSISAGTLRTCPKDLCGQKKWGRGRVKRQIGAGAGFIFKGTGFYITDHRSEGYKEAAKQATGDAKPAAKPETKADTKVETKAETKADTKVDAKAGTKPASAVGKK
jgi:putative FmdB family regulatory protein